MKTQTLLIGLAFTAVLLPAQEPAMATPALAATPTPSIEVPPFAPPSPVLPFAADPAYMQTASAAFKATGSDPDVQAAEERLKRVRAESALRIEEAELALELMRLKKGEVAGVKPTEVTARRKAEMEERLKILAAHLGRENAATAKAQDGRDAK